MWMGPNAVFYVLKNPIGISVYPLLNESHIVARVSKKKKKDLIRLTIGHQNQVEIFLLCINAMKRVAFV